MCCFFKRKTAYEMRISDWSSDVGSSELRFAAKSPVMAKTILIVEDNELNMKLFHDLLEAQGYDILQTRDGMEALKMARSPRPHLILMDIQLPAVSGLEVTKWL